MFKWEIEKIKEGKKVKQISDGTIWEVTKRLNDTNWAIERVEGENTLVGLLNVEKAEYSVLCNSYTFKLPLQITIDAESEEEARSWLADLPFSMDESVVYDVSDAELLSKKENE